MPVVAPAKDAVTQLKELTGDLVRLSYSPRLSSTALTIPGTTSADIPQDAVAGLATAGPTHATVLLVPLVTFRLSVPAPPARQIT